jgi:hypothetical protein
MKSKILAVSFSLLGVTAGLAQTSTTPSLLSYQGRVTDATGALVGNSTPVNRDVKFQLYTASSGGTPVWAETQTVTISGGEFSVLIGNGSGISGLTGPSAPAPTPYKKLPDILNASSNPSGVSFYLGVTVDDGNSGTTDAEISPRQQFVAGAYALRATVAESVASSAITTAMIADSNITTSKIADSNITSAKIADSTIVTADLANSVVTAAKLDTSSIGVWSVSGSNVYRSGGLVGIGTSSPTAPLHVFAGSSTSPDSNGLYLYNPTNSANQNAIATVRTAGASAGSPFFSMDVSGVAGWSMGIDNADSQKFKIANAWYSPAANTRLTITTAGNVGIGQTNPGYPLSFADSLGAKISLFGQGTSHYGFGIQGSLLQIYSDSAGSDIAFGYGSSTSFTERMRVKGNGNVGIGTNSPPEKLTINGGWLRFDSSDTGIIGYNANNDYWRIYGTGGDNAGELIIQSGDDGTEPIWFYQAGTLRGGVASDGWFNAGAGVGFRTSSSEAQSAIYNNGRNLTLALYNGSQAGGQWRNAIYDGDSNWDFNSDIRLKKDIVDAEPMLDRLLQVRFRRYHWKDSDSTEPLSFGVIAQELEPLFPQLVGEQQLLDQDQPYKTVAYTEFATIASKAVQELAARTDDQVDELRAALAAKDAQIDALAARTDDQVDAMRAALAAKDAQIDALDARLAALEKLLTATK